MSTFTVRPRYRELGYDYNAPVMIIEATKHNEAIEIAKNSSLGRFPEWSFHVEPFHKKEIHKRWRKFVDRTDNNSKSQKGKLVTGQGLSRPQRRALRRKQMGSYPQGCKQTTKFKCW